jgi:hypothetical protein
MFDPTYLLDCDAVLFSQPREDAIFTDFNFSANGFYIFLAQHASEMLSAAYPVRIELPLAAPAIDHVR